MRKVERCVMRPLHCAVFPTLGAAHRKGYYDVDVNLAGPGIYENRVYVSVEAVEHLARVEGWTSPEELAALVAENERLETAKAELEARLDAAEAVVDSIDVIESAAFRARKRTGRPKEKVA